MLAKEHNLRGEKRGWRDLYLQWRAIHQYLIHIIYKKLQGDILLQLGNTLKTLVLQAQCVCSIVLKDASCLLVWEIFMWFSSPIKISVYVQLIRNFVCLPKVQITILLLYVCCLVEPIDTCKVLWLQIEGHGSGSMCTIISPKFSLTNIKYFPFLQWLEVWEGSSTVDP